MKKMKILLALIVLTFAYACGQKADDTFTKPMYFTQPAYFNGGFWLGGVFYTTIPTGGTGSMVYPGTGIPVSTGTAWGTSIVNNSANWNTAFGWGNHAGLYSLLNHNHSTLYKPIGYVPTWAEITGKPSLFDGTWTSLTGKPVTYPSDWATTANKPVEIELSIALEQLGIYLGKTTAEINAITPTNGFGIAFDKTLGVYKVYENGWKVLITAN